MYKINELITPRKDVLEGALEGVIQTHKVDSGEARIESNPTEFLKITYPSAAIKKVLEKVREKISGKSNQGGFLLVGPYGSGKSHTLITLYHLFNNPSQAEEWGKRWNIDLEVPDKSRSVIVSTRRVDVDYLWEPIFKHLGREDLLERIKRFPTVDQIEEAIGEGCVAIFIDEIENWYGSFDREKQSHLIEQNETFLEHLLEVAADPKRKLFVFITFLEEKEGLKKIFNRTKPVRIDVSPIEDREKVVIHRLFENWENVNNDKKRSVIEQYINAYSGQIKIDNIQNYKRRMVRTYPFHPLLLDTVFQIYEAAAERQDLRGMLNVLADTVKATYKTKDLILLSHMDEAFLYGIDLNLSEKYKLDLERVKEIRFAREILKTILILTLNGKEPGATETHILLSIFTPTEGHTLNAISMDIENLYGKCYYLHKVNDVYIFKSEPNIWSILEKESSKVSEEEAKKKIVEIMKEEIFENRVIVMGFDNVPDNNKLKIVVVPEFWGANGELKNKLEEFYKGKMWQNTYILVLPKTAIFSFEILEKGKRVIASENLMHSVKDEGGKLRKIIQEERRAIAEKISPSYGYIVKWALHNGEIEHRLINVKANINDILEKAKVESGVIEDSIVKVLETEPKGKRVEELIEDFKKQRKYPLIQDDETISATIEKLFEDKRVIVEGERGKRYIEETPGTIDPSFVVIHPKFVEEVEQPEEEQPQEEKKEFEMPKDFAWTAESVRIAKSPVVIERKEKCTVPMKGNSPRVIVSQIEARTNEKDEFEELTVRYRFKRRLTKQDVMKLVKLLPQQEEEVDLEVEAILWREKDEN